MKTPLLDGIKKSADVSLPILAKILNSNFSPPFMPKEYVRAKINKRGELALYIGNRDVSIDKDGKVIGSGSLLVGGWKKPEKTHDYPGLLDGISKKAKKQHVRPLRGTGKTTGMFRRINNLQQGIHYGKKKVTPLLNGIIKDAMHKKANVEKLKKKHGIGKTEDGCIGFSPTEKKWWGWSHRAAYGFGVGDKMKKGDAGYIPSKGVWTAKTLEDAKQMAADFAESVS